MKILTSTSRIHRIITRAKVTAVRRPAKWMQSRRLFCERLETREVLSGFVEGFGGAGSDNPFRAPTLDPSGNMYVSGYFTSAPADFDPGAGVDNLSSAGGNDAFIARYNADGSLAWARSFGGSGSDEGVQAVYSHETTGDYVYFAGWFSGTVDFGPNANGQDITLTSAGGEDAFLMKMDANTGATAWAEQFGGASNDYPAYMAAANGTLNLTGNFGGTVDFDPGPGTANLTDPTGSGSGSAFELTLDSAGNYLGAFDLSASGTNSVLTTGGLVVDGSTMYIRGIYTGTADFDPGPATQTMTSTGRNNVFVAAYSIANQSPANPNPTLLWDRSLSLFSSGIRGNLSEDANNLYLATVAGSDPNASGIEVASLSKADGSINWQYQALGNATTSGISASSTVLNPVDGSLYVGGYYWYPTFDFDASNPGGEVVNNDPASSANADPFVLKLNAADGTYRQVWSFGGTGTDVRLAGLTGSNLYAAGAFQSTTTFPNGAALTSVGGNDVYLMSLDTSAAQVSINSFAQAEGSSGPNPFNFTVTRSGDTSGTTTVNWSTADGTATAASGDYLAASGQLIFAPGETTKTIAVTVNGDTTIEPDENFTVHLSNPIGGNIASGIGQATIANDDFTKFYVANDGSPDRTYEYTATGAPVENYTIASGNTVPRGIATTAAGLRMWVVDANRNVYVYNTSGGLLGSWSAGSMNPSADVEGITTNGTDVWIVDAKGDKVYKYANAASRLSGSQTAASSFSLTGSNASASDLVTDGTSIWVVDNGASTDRVFEYTVGGALVGSWTLSGGGGNPTGITINPASPSDIWIVDSATDKVYDFAAAASRTTGSQSPASSFALVAGNTNPQGIADPPASTAGILSSSASLHAHSDALLSVASDLEAIFGLGRKRR